MGMNKEMMIFLNDSRAARVITAAGSHTLAVNTMMMQDTEQIYLTDTELMLQGLTLEAGDKLSSLVTKGFSMKQ